MIDSDPHVLRQLLDEYLVMYASRDDALASRFSENFSGFTGGGDFLVKDRERWVEITRQDFAQVKAAVRIELKDVSIQSLAETIAVATAFFTIRLPIQDQIFSKETARLVLIFRHETGDGGSGWKIAHSSISIPYSLVREGEIYPLHELAERNRALEEQVSARTTQLTEATESLSKFSAELTQEIAGRHGAEAKARESEAVYRSILDASPDDITLADLEGRITMVSPRSVSMFGYDYQGQAIGRHVNEFLVPEDRERASAKVALLFQGITPGPGEYRALRMDGSTFDVEVNTALVRGPDDRVSGFVVIVRDITARKVAEAALRESEEKYRTLVERAGEAIIILQDGVFVFGNRKVSELLGVSVANLLGLPFIDFVWPADREQVFSNYTRRLSGAEVPAEYDFRVVGPGGRETWVIHSVALISWQGRPATLHLVTDITGRKHAEATLQNAFDQIKTLRGLLPICMYCKKIRDTQGHWNPVEVYVRARTEAEFSHGLCPECEAKWYPEKDEGQ